MFQKLDAMRHLKYARSARRETTGHGIVFKQRALAIFVQPLGPRLERSHFACVVQIREQPVAVHADVAGALFSTKLASLGYAQYPFLRGTTPKRGCPSGQRGR